MSNRNYVFVGLLCAFGLLIGMFTVNRVLAQTPTAARVDTGRYQVQGVSGAVFLVDTQSGKTWLWATAADPSIGQAANPTWLPQERLDNSAQVMAWLKRNVLPK